MSDIFEANPEMTMGLVGAFALRAAAVGSSNALTFTEEELVAMADNFALAGDIGGQCGSHTIKVYLRPLTQAEKDAR